MTWEVLESLEEVALASEIVAIDEAGLASFATELELGGLFIPTWDPRYHYFDGGEATVAYLLVLDTLNFCFWPRPGDERWEIEYDGERLSGYVALAAALKRAFESGSALHDASYLSALSMDTLQGILSGTGQLQLVEERLSALRELGRVLLGRYGGRASRLVEAAEGSAVGLARLLARELASFRDKALYKGKDVYFYKRAQIVAADVWGAFQGTRWGSFSDMEQLTAFADYKLPQVLRQLGILRYMKSLEVKVDSMAQIPCGCPEEVEIRANTVWAVHRIVQELGRRGVRVRDFELDWILWRMGQGDAFRQRPYHRTVTVFY